MATRITQGMLCTDSCEKLMSPTAKYFENDIPLVIRCTNKNVRNTTMLKKCVLSIKL
jgi:hypothetical protein